MQRRSFITLLGGASAAWPFAAGAQQGVPLVAVLNAFSERDPEAQSWYKAFVERLAALGWTNSRNLRIDIRWASGEVSVLRIHAKGLVDLRPDVVYAVTTPSVHAIRHETGNTPIVFAHVTDPVAQGLVQSLARPGGNITGFTIFEPEIGSKWVQALKEIAPETARAAVIFNPDTAPYYRLFMQSIEVAGATVAVETFEAPVRSRADIEATMTALALQPATGVIPMADSFTHVHRDLIIALAARYRLPTAYPFSFHVKEGGLISYGVDLFDMNRGAASYVDRILKGTKPSDLPVQLPTKYELVINLAAARALGREIPLGLLTRADQVIE
jgi:putative ABC transport system substrate-binding protein